MRIGALHRPPPSKHRLVYIPPPPSLQLKRSKPKQDELQKLLSVGHPGNLEGSADKVWTLEELEQKVQGSREEVLAMIGQMNALEVPGGWRAVDESVVHPVLDRLLSEITIAGINMDEVRKEKGRGPLDLNGDIYMSSGPG